MAELKGPRFDRHSRSGRRGVRHRNEPEEDGSSPSQGERGPSSEHVDGDITVGAPSTAASGPSPEGAAIDDGSSCRRQHDEEGESNAADGEIKTEADGGAILTARDTGDLVGYDADDEADSSPLHNENGLASDGQDGDAAVNETCAQTSEPSPDDKAVKEGPSSSDQQGKQSNDLIMLVSRGEKRIIEFFRMISRTSKSSWQTITEFVIGYIFQPLKIRVSATIQTFQKLEVTLRDAVKRGALSLMDLTISIVQQVVQSLYDAFATLHSEYKATAKDIESILKNLVDYLVRKLSSAYKVISEATWNAVKATPGLALAIAVGIVNEFLELKAGMQDEIMQIRDSRGDEDGIVRGEGYVLETVEQDEGIDAESSVASLAAPYIDMLLGGLSKTSRFVASCVGKKRKVCEIEGSDAIESNKKTKCSSTTVSAIEQPDTRQMSVQDPLPFYNYQDLSPSEENVETKPVQFRLAENVYGNVIVYGIPPYRVPGGFSYQVNLNFPLPSLDDIGEFYINWLSAPGIPGLHRGAVHRIFWREAGMAQLVVRHQCGAKLTHLSVIAALYGRLFSLGMPSNFPQPLDFQLAIVQRDQDAQQQQMQQEQQQMQMQQSVLHTPTPFSVEGAGYGIGPSYPQYSDGFVPPNQPGFGTTNTSYASNLDGFVAPSQHSFGMAAPSYLQNPNGYADPNQTGFGTTFPSHLHNATGFVPPSQPSFGTTTPPYAHNHNGYTGVNHSVINNPTVPPPGSGQSTPSSTAGRKIKAATGARRN